MTTEHNSRKKKKTPPTPPGGGKGILAADRVEELEARLARYWPRQSARRRRRTAEALAALDGQVVDEVLERMARFRRRRPPLGALLEACGAAPRRLRRITDADLRDAGAIGALFAEAVAAGLVERSEHSELEFHALAVHCRERGERPADLFWVLLRDRRYDLVTNVEEDRALAERRAVTLMSRSERDESVTGGAELSLDARRILRALRLGFRYPEIVRCLTTGGWTHERILEARREILGGAA